MRIAFLSAGGALSFDAFRLGQDSRLTVVVGPNGAGKSNLARLLGVCQRAIECADELAELANALRQLARRPSEG